MPNEPKRRGRPPTGRPQKMRVMFNVSPDEFAWLQTIKNRSEWLSAKINLERIREENEKQ